MLAERFGVEVPSYRGDYASVADHERLADLVAGREEDWLRLEPGRERPGDVVLLRLRGLPIHVGLIVAQGWMLHVEARADAVLERFDGLEWRNRVLGIYRHDSIATRDPAAT